MTTQPNGAKIKRLSPRPETVAKREEIIDAAVEVFGAHGYTDATLEEIGERVGLTHAGVLHHFGSKKNLLLDAVRRRDVTDSVPFDNDNLPLGMDMFTHLLHSTARNSKRPGIVQAFVTLSAEALTEQNPTREHFKGRYQGLRERLGDALELLCSTYGVDDPEGVKSAASGILAIMDGVQYQWLLDPGKVDLLKGTEYGIRAILSQLLGPMTSRWSCRRMTLCDQTPTTLPTT